MRDPGRWSRSRRARRWRVHPRSPRRLRARLGVDAGPADLREVAGEMLEHLRERGHRVAGEEAAPRGDRRQRDRLAALHEATFPEVEGDGHDPTSVVTGRSKRKT